MSHLMDRARPLIDTMLQWMHRMPHSIDRMGHPMHRVLHLIGRTRGPIVRARRPTLVRLKRREEELARAAFQVQEA